MATATIDGMSPCFTKDDKGLLVDGHIDMFNKGTSKKKELIGKIHVQIKGTATRSPSKNTLKKNIDVIDLEKYLTVFKGVLYFYVAMNRSGAYRKIYYLNLLPYDLKKILNELPDKKQKSILLKFVELPSDPEEIHRVCLYFLEHQDRQSSVPFYSFDSVDQMKETGLNFSSYEIGMCHFPDEPPFPTLKNFDQGDYIYGITSYGVEIVIDKLEAPDAICFEGETVVSSGEAKLRAIVSMTQSKDGDSLEFRGFAIPTDNSSLIFNERGSFRERLEDLELIHEMGRTGQLSFNGALALEGAKLDSELLDGVKHRIAIIKHIVSLLDFLAVKVEWDPQSLTKDELAKLNILATGFLDGKEVDLDIGQTSIVGPVISGSRIILLAQKNDSGKCRLLDFLGDTESNIIGISESKEPNSPIHPAPPMLALSQEGFQHACNLDAERFEKSCDSYPICIELGEHACMELLYMLEAYDAGAVCAEDLLRCCNILADRLAVLAPSCETYKINQLQTRKRIRALTEEEINEARSLALDSESTMVKASAFIILEQDELASKLLEGLTPQEKEAFDSWPISHLRNQHNG